MNEEKEEQALTPEQEELHRLIAAYDGSVTFPTFVEMKADLSLDITKLRDMAQGVMLANDPRYAPPMEHEPPVKVISELQIDSFSLVPETARLHPSWNMITNRFEPEPIENVPSIRRQQLEALQSIQHTLQAIYEQESSWITQCTAWRAEDKAVGDARHTEVQARWDMQQAREEQYAEIARERNAQEQAAHEATLAMYQQWRKEDVERVQTHNQHALEQQPLVLNGVIREEVERVGQALLSGMEDVRFQHAITEGKPHVHVKASLAQYLPKDKEED